jgi:nucleotide-binding universal stress UspA family protein
MIEIKKVMVPVDFSRESMLAAKFAVSIAMEYGAELFVVHVVRPMNPTVRASVPDFEALQATVMKSAQEDLDKVIPGEIKKSLKKVNEILLEGEPHIEIPEKAKELGVEMLVIATHGRTGLSHVLLGSVAERVIRHAPCPVLVVRNPMDKFVYGWQ